MCNTSLRCLLTLHDHEMFKTKEVNLKSGKSSWRWKPNQTLRSLLLSVLWLGHQPVGAFEAMWDNQLLPQPSPSWILRNVVTHGAH